MTHYSQFGSNNITRANSNSINLQNYHTSNINLKSLEEEGDNGKICFNIIPSQHSENITEIIRTNEMNRLRAFAELESKILLLEQNEKNLKRQKQKLQLEVAELKMQLEKPKMEENFDSVSNDKINDPMSKLTMKEAQDIIKELLTEVEELKKEKTEISENALNILTEKELTNMELKEKLDELKNRLGIEINNHKEIYSLEDNIENSTSNNISPPTQLYGLIDKPRKQSSSEASLIESSILIERIVSLEKDKENLLSYLREEKHNNNIIISNLEDTISRLKEDLINKDFDKENYVKMINQDEINKDEVFLEIESLQNTIRLMEEKHQKSEINSKQYIKKLKDELNELDQNNKNLRSINEELNRELIMINIEFNKKIKNLDENNKAELAQKESDFKRLQNKYDEWMKEKSLILNEFDVCKKNNQIIKENYAKSQKSLQNVKENYEKEKKIYEDKIMGNDIRSEAEKNKLIEQLTLLQTKFNQLLNTHGKLSPGKFKYLISDLNMLNDESKIDTPRNNTDISGLNNSLNYDETNKTNLPVVSLNKQSTLSDCLQDNEDSPETVILDLQNQIKVYELQNNELKMKIKNLSKYEKEIEILKIENINMKDNCDKMKITYENQIKEFQSRDLNPKENFEEQIKDLLNQNTFLKQNYEEQLKDLQTQNNNLKINYEVKLNDLLSINLALNEKLLAQENNNVNKKNSILMKSEDNFIKINNLNLEIENLKSAMKKEKELYKMDLINCNTIISKLKIELAEISYEKEAEMVKVKNENKKLKQDMNKKSQNPFKKI